MSKIKLTGHASGSGVLTIAAPNTDSDRTITLPDVTGTLLDSGSDLPAANLTGTVADARISTLTASKLTGNLPAISGASLTNLPADATKLPLAGGTITGLLKVYPSNGQMRIADSNGDNKYAELEASNGRLFLHSDKSNAESNSDMRFYIDNSEKMRITSDGDVRSETNASFWVNFNGQSTVAIRDSHNVSSVGDWGTGNYGLYISGSLTNANYAVVGTTDLNRFVGVCLDHQNPTSGRWDFYTTKYTGTAQDRSYVYVVGIGGR